MTSLYTSFEIVYTSTVNTRLPPRLTDKTMEVVDIVGEGDGVFSTAGQDEEALQMLTERQNMERKEELMRINLMGRVSHL